MKIKSDNKYVLYEPGSRPIIIGEPTNLKLCGESVKAYTAYNLATVDETSHISPYRKYASSYSNTFVAFKHDIYNEYMIEVSLNANNLIDFVDISIEIRQRNNLYLREENYESHV